MGDPNNSCLADGVCVVEGRCPQSDGQSTACLNVNHINDNPGHFTCDCVDPNNSCLADGVCVVEGRCPQSDGQSTATTEPTVEGYYIEDKGENSCSKGSEIMTKTGCRTACAALDVNSIGKLKN